MNRLFLLLNTVKYLKWQQVYYRLHRKLFKLTPTIHFKLAKPQRPKTWKHISLYSTKIDSSLNATFLNETRKLQLETTWDVRPASKLWNYNLHYFEDLMSENHHEKEELHIWLLKQWILKNPIGFGVGWEPYPTSLRIVNILKSWLGGLNIDNEIFKSLYLQTSFLSKNLEKHLLGNHYFANLKALLFAGVVFKKDNRIRNC